MRNVELAGLSGETLFLEQTRLLIIGLIEAHLASIDEQAIGIASAICEFFAGDLEMKKSNNAVVLESGAIPGGRLRVSISQDFVGARFRRDGVGVERFVSFSGLKSAEVINKRMGDDAYRGMLLLGLKDGNYIRIEPEPSSSNAIKYFEK